MLSKKILALFFIAVFGLQSCSKGVSPTKGASSLNPNSTTTDVATTVNDVLCLEEGDSDSDGDGICDADDVDESGFDCSEDENCIDGEHGDEYVHPEKSKWWITVGSIAVGATGATLIAHKLTDDWWWNDIIKKKPDEGSTIFTVATDKNGQLGVESTEEFSNSGGSVFNLFNVKMKATNGYNLKDFGGDSIAKGENILVCIKSTFGFELQSGTTFKATYHLGDYQKSDYTKAIVGQHFTEEAFKSHCNEKGGAFLGLQDKQNGSTYTIFPIPSRLLNSSKTENLNSPAMDVNYIFKSLPTSDINSSTEIRYYRQNVQFTENITLDYVTKITDSVKIEEYNDCATDFCRAGIVFGTLTGRPKTEAKPDTAQLADNIEAYKNTIPSESVFDNDLPL